MVSLKIDIRGHFFTAISTQYERSIKNDVELINDIFGYSFGYFRRLVKLQGFRVSLFV